MSLGVSESASEWVSESVSDWVSEWVCEWVSLWVSESVSEWVCERERERSHIYKSIHSSESLFSSAKLSQADAELFSRDENNFDPFEQQPHCTGRVCDEEGRMRWNYMYFEGGNEWFASSDPAWNTLKVGSPLKARFYKNVGNFKSEVFLYHHRQVTWDVSFYRKTCKSRPSCCIRIEENL